MLYCSWDIWCVTDVIVIFHFGLFFAFYRPNSPKNQNLQKKTTTKETTKKKKDTWRYHFTHEYQKLWLDDVRFLGYGARWTDGRKKWHMEVGALPKKINISNRVQLSLGWKKKNCKPSSLTQTLIYMSNIYYSKIYKREDWKNSSSTLHLEVSTRYFRHRYSINSLKLQWI